MILVLFELDPAEGGREACHGGLPLSLGLAQNSQGLEAGATVAALRLHALQPTKEK